MTQYSPEVMRPLVVALIAIATTIFAYALLRSFIKSLQAIKERSEDGQVILITSTTSSLTRAFLPFARQLGQALRVLFRGDDKNSLYATFLRKITSTLASAGYPQGLNADEYIGFWIIIALFGGIFGGAVYVAQGEDAFADIYAYFAVGVIAGLIYWRAWLIRQMEVRQTAIRRELPFCLDLMTLATDAGLDFTDALGRMSQRLGNSPLGQEFTLMLREIQLGKSRSQALRDFASRVDLSDVRTVVSSLLQAEELGSPLGPILRMQASQQREKRSQRAEEQAMKAPVKLLFPLVAFIFPATLLVIFGMLIINGMFGL